MPDLCEVRVKVNSGGLSTNINTILNGYFLREIDGLGYEVRRLSQRGPFQKGDTDLGFAHDARLLTLVWDLQQGSPADLWTLRAELMGVFRPRTGDPAQLIFTFPNGDRRACDMNLDGTFNYSPSDRRDARTQSIAAVLKSDNDPRLYDPIRKQVEFNLLDFISGWEIEETGETTADGWNIEETGQTTGDGWNIGVSTINKIGTISYGNGYVYADVEYPVIRIFGPITSPKVENLTTGEVLDFSANGGLSLSLGQWVEIDLRYRSGKTAVDQDGNSVDQYLTTDSDLATWHLSYNTELLDAALGTRSTGDNQIRVTGGGANLSTRVQVLYYDRYLGA